MKKKLFSFALIPAILLSPQGTIHAAASSNQSTVSGNLSADEGINSLKLELPNLLSKTNVSKFSTHSYSYHGIKLGTTKDQLVNLWGNPIDKYEGRGFGYTDGQYLYGYQSNVTIKTFASKETIPFEETAIREIVFSSHSHKYEYTKVLPLYKKLLKAKTTSTHKYLYNDSLKLTFSPYKGKFYATKVTYTNPSGALIPE